MFGHATIPLTPVIYYNENGVFRTTDGKLLPFRVPESAYDKDQIVVHQI